MKSVKAAGFLCMVLAVSVLSASDVDGRRKISSYLDEVFPHIAFGGPWKTTITFMNLEATDIEFPLTFYTQSGKPLEVPIVGVGRKSQISVKVKAGGSTTVDLEDTDPGTTSGWAMIDQPSGNGIVGQAVYRIRVPGRPDLEAIVPLSDQFEDEFVLAFDNTQGFTTSVAFANPASFSSTTVYLDFKDESGARIVLDSVDLKALEQTAFEMPTRFSATAGRKGVLHVKSSSFVFSCLAFRFNSSGGFTTFFPFQK